MTPAAQALVDLIATKLVEVENAISAEVQNEVEAAIVQFADDTTQGLTTAIGIEATARANAINTLTQRVTSLESPGYDLYLANNYQ